ncbi:IQ domain-containing protein N isoform X3 [Rattus norvegicus]|uniref:IQ domain-containing protein N isoform X3 n=1 Tax=Rattus norvegicus TaxID=10116 RepID=UPI0003D07C97|nr:IQ domain-containing protein N isoform X3 [Rattus norvegicus]|eukprot:XP_017455823.1 PREDICTED: uncharacterized protein KIAA1683 homolog isoform X3 [Rattus norvegicus]
MAAMQPAAQLQFQNLMSPSRPCLPQPTPIHQEKVAKLRPQIQNDSYPPKELTVLASQEVPRLRAVVESQAFRNILVDEMDMMVSRAATVIQANWKGYRLRQKLISQMTAAKAIQEAWRRFSTRRLMHSNKLTAKKAKREDDGDIPYHQPQQVRFHAPEDQSPLMVTKETQFPSSDNLVSSQATAGPCASRVPRGGLDRHTGPKHQPCMLTKTFQSSCLMRHLEGDSVKIRHVASKTIKVGTLEPAATGRYGQAIHGSLKTQTQTHTETDVPKVPLHIYQINKVPTKVCPAAAAAPKSPATMSTAPKSAPQTRPSSPATVTTVTTVTKMPAPTSPTSPMIRPLVPVPPNSSLSSTTPQMQVRSMVPGVRAQPPVSAVSPTIKALPRLGTFVTKAPLQTGPGFAVTKNLIQTRPVTRSQAQTCAVSTPSKTCQSSPTVKPSPQTRLAAMITKTPAQLRSVAAVFRTLCGGSTEAAVPSSPKSSSQSPVIAGNTASQVHLTNPKAKVTVSTKQTPAVVKVASQSYLAEGKGRCGPQGNLDIIPKPPPAKSPLEVEKMKPCPARASKKEAALKTNTTIATRALSWTKVMEDRSKALTQIEQRAEIVKVHFRVYMPEEITVTLSQAQLAVPLTKTCPQTRPSPCHARTLLASPCCKALSQSCTPSRLAPGTPEGRRPPVGLSASLSSSPLAAHLMSLTAQLQPAGEQARSVSRDHPTTSRPTSACPQSRSSGMTSVPPEGPVDAGLAAGQSWNSKVPNVSVRATAHAGAPPGIWPSRGHKPWDPSGAEAALDRKPSAELLMSVQAMEKVVVQAVVTIQACTRGYLVRRTVKVWHQWATIIQATWRGYRVRRNLERLFRATTIIQAAWRGYSIRRARTRHILLPTAWPEHGGRTQGNLDSRSSSEHRCFLSCQPDVCSVCQSLGPPVESPPSVVMLVGSQPRTCHVCGHTLSTRVVQGFGQGASVHSVSRWTSASQQSTLSQQHRACTIIQAAWKGYRTRRQLRQQQSAAKMVQAMWRGHYTRSCLTTDALLGTGGPWSISRDISRRTSRAYSLHWPGV